MSLSNQEYKWVPANSQGCLIKYSRSRRLEERSSLAEDLHPYPGGVVILLLASCYGNRNKLRLKSYMARVQSLPFTHLYLSFMKYLQNWYQSSIIDGVEGRQISKCQRECQKVFEKIIQRYESLTDNSYLRSPVTVCYFRSRRVYGSTMGHNPSGYKLSRHLWCQSSHVIS